MGGRKVYYCWVVQRFGIVKAGSGGSEILPFLTSGGEVGHGRGGAYTYMEREFGQVEMR